jgi:ABC-type nickel/cobalt efflux system permease component RcnA
MRRRLLATLAALVLALTFGGTAAAHPLGNFTVNQYSRVEAGRDLVRVRYIVDMAEIPAFQERAQIDADGDGAVSDAEAQRYLADRAPSLAAGLRLDVNGTPVALHEVDRRIAFPPGQGGLNTLRITIDFEAPVSADGYTVSYQVSNYDERLGWREIVVRAGDGAALRESSAPADDQSSELTAYPQETLTTPLDVRTATFTVTPGGGSALASGIAEHVPAVASDTLSALVSPRELTPMTMATALLLALMLGAGHALTPGHGKTIVAAYLVGARGTALHAVVLGLVTTVTHTAGVFILGFATLLLSRYVLPEQIYPWLELVSGALVVALGVGLLRSRFAALVGRTVHRGHSQGHGHDHDHHHGPGGHTHDHDTALADALAGTIQNPKSTIHNRVSWRGLLALGISGGLLPCPSALVVLLGAIAIGRVGFGMLLIVAFSLGLAAVLTAIGLLLVYARGFFERMPTNGLLLRALPVASAAIVVLAGLGVTAAAVGQL